MENNWRVVLFRKCWLNILYNDYGCRFHLVTCSLSLFFLPRCVNVADVILNGLWFLTRWNYPTGRISSFLYKPFIQRRINYFYSPLSKTLYTVQCRYIDWCWRWGSKECVFLWCRQRVMINTPSFNQQKFQNNHSFECSAPGGNSSKV